MHSEDKLYFYPGREKSVWAGLYVSLGLSFTTLEFMLLSLSEIYNQIIWLIVLMVGIVLNNQLISQ